MKKRKLKGDSVIKDSLITALYGKKHHIIQISRYNKHGGKDF